MKNLSYDGQAWKRSSIAYKSLAITIKVFHCVCPRILQHCSFSMIGIHPLCPKWWDIPFSLFGTWFRNMSNYKLGGKLDIKHHVSLANSELWLVWYICTICCVFCFKFDFHLLPVAWDSRAILRIDSNVTSYLILVVYNGFFF